VGWCALALALMSSAAFVFSFFVFFSFFPGIRSHLRAPIESPFNDVSILIESLLKNSFKSFFKSEGKEKKISLIKSFFFFTPFFLSSFFLFLQRIRIRLVNTTMCGPSTSHG